MVFATSLQSLVRPLAVIAAFGAGLGTAQADRLVKLQPGEATSKDVFVYQFNIPGSFGIPTPAAATNLDTATLNQIPTLQAPFGLFLGSAETDPFTDAMGLHEHATRSLLQFDLAGLALTAAQVVHATINLYQVPGLPPFEDPSKAHPVTTDLKRVTEAWGEQTVTWDTRPSVDPTPVATVMQSAVNQWVQFDITGLVRDWLNNPLANFGVEISQRGIVEIPVPGDTRYAASLYASSAYPVAADHPFLAITAVPEPASLVVLAGSLALFGGLARRRPA